MKFRHERVLLVPRPHAPPCSAPAGTWLHWLVYDLAPSTAMLVEAADVAKAGGKEGKNSWDRTGYGGPCPPDGKHRYLFRLWAVDYMLGLDASATRDAVEEAMGKATSWRRPR